MTDREFRKLKRIELIEIIYQLQTELEDTKKKVEDKQQKEITIPTIDQVRLERDKLRNRKEYRRTAVHILEILVVAAAISVLLATVFFPIIRVSGVSMEPTLENGQVIVLEKTGNFKTGDLIAFYYQNKILLKRVIGCSGDYIDIDADGNVYVNDIKLEEPYLKDRALGECDITLPYQVPEGKIFVMGDHRSKSIDSRSRQIGCVSEEQVAGRVMFRLWPLKDIGFLNQ